MWRMLIVGVLLITGCSMSVDTKQAEQIVPQFHQQLNEEKYQEIYAATGAPMKQASTYEDFSALLSAVHQKLGRIQSTTQKSWNANYSLSQAVITMVYETAFERGKATEQFVVLIKDGRTELVGYHINSNALITI